LRLSTGYSGLALAVLWVGAVAFGVDLLFSAIGAPLNQLQRALALLVYVGVGVWAFRRFTLPWLGGQETDLQMALLVERQERIDSDLIAAMQFESPEAKTWGSERLEEAVIVDVADRSPRLDIMRGLSAAERNRRLALLAGTAALWGVCTFFFSGHVAAFLNRLALGAKHYPTRTQIESITVAERDVDPERPWETKIYCLYGQPVRFVVRCGGELPEKGEALLRSVRSGRRATLAIEPVAGQPGLFQGELDRLIEPIDYQLYFGDAWTDRARLDVATLPVVDLALEVSPPPYAIEDDAGPLSVPSGLRQVSVIEGSRVVMKVRADKTLERATVTIDDRDYPFARDPDAEKDDWEDHWILAGSESPLAAVTEATRYAVQVTDEEDQQLEAPIEGVIRIQADAAPRIAGGVVTRLVLPAARPTIYFKAIDDYGLARISLVCEAVRTSGEKEEREIDVFLLKQGAKAPRTIEPEAGFALQLSAFELEKGDTLKVTLKAVDYRGPRPGREGLADPLVFQVTDEQGILAHMMEADRQSARQLKTMIQRQLGIGESP
jgi:hypothetical protein